MDLSDTHLDVKHNTVKFSLGNVIIPAQPLGKVVAVGESERIGAQKTNIF